MHIRGYRNDDWQRLCEVHDAARKHELEASGLADAFLTLEQTAENEGLFSGSVLVAEDEGRVLGFAAYCELELTWLYVDPSMYRRGVGRLLLQHVIEANSGEELTTEVLVGNKSALELYLSEGFQIVKRVDGKLTGNERFPASGYVLARPPGDA